MSTIRILLDVILFVWFVIAAWSQSDDWVISSSIVLPDAPTTVQRHPSVSDIAYGSRMQSGLDTLKITDDVVQLLRTDAPTDPSYAYYRLHASTFNHHLYVAANSGGVIMYDITTNASHPILSATNLHPTSSSPAHINDMTTDANYVYAVGYQDGFFFSVLSHDLSTIYGEFRMPEATPYNQLVSVYVMDDVTIATGDNIGRIWTWSIANLPSLTITGWMEAPPYVGGIYSVTSSYNSGDDGDILLATHSVEGILSVNISQSPYTYTVEIDEALGGRKGGFPWWIERVGSIGYVANSNSGISIVDVSNLGSFNVIDFMYDGPKDGPIATSLVAYGLAVFDTNRILVPNAGQAAAAGYVIFKNVNADTSTTTTIIPAIVDTDTPTQAPTDTITPSPLTSRPSLAPTNTITNPPTQAPIDLSTPSPLTNRPSLAPTNTITNPPTQAPIDVSTPAPVTNRPSVPPTNTPSPVSTTNVNTTHEITTTFNTTLLRTDSSTSMQTNTDVMTTRFDFGEEVEEHLDDLEQLSGLFQMTAGAFVAVCVAIGLLSFIDASIIRPNDYFNATALLTMMIQTVDIMSDCFFVLEAKIQTNNAQFNDSELQMVNIILYASILCIAVPSLVSLFQLYFYAKRHWLNNDYVRSWLTRYATALLLLSIATGSSFAAISLLNSFIFQIEIFDMGLTDKEIKQFHTQRIYSIVIMENVPQVLIQSYYIYYVTGASGDNLIAMSSIMFSFISVIVSVLSLTLIKKINNTQRYVVLSMDVTGDCVEEKSAKCRTMKNNLEKRVCALIGVDGRMLDIMKPTYISNGLRVQMRVYVNNKSQSNNYGNVLIAANENGKLSQMFQKHWNLSDTPEICDIESDIVDPTQETTQKTEQKETLNKDIERATTNI